MNLRKLLIFGVVGIIATPGHYITLILLVEVGGFGPVIATCAGSATGALANYLLNHRYTFKSTKRHFDAGPKFMSVALGSGVLNALLVFVGVDLLGVHYLLVQFVATFIVFLINFLLNSVWTFHEERACE